MSATQTSQRPTMRGECLVKNWLDWKHYGFLFNPDQRDKRNIFVHNSLLPIRMGIGKRLLAGEPVHVHYTEDDQKRLNAVKIEFPSRN